MYRVYRIPYKELEQELNYIEEHKGEIVKIETIIEPDYSYLNSTCNWDKKDKHWVMVVVKSPEIIPQKNYSTAGLNTMDS